MKIGKMQKIDVDGFTVTMLLPFELIACFSSLLLICNWPEVSKKL